MNMTFLRERLDPWFFSALWSASANLGARDLRRDFAQLPSRPVWLVLASGGATRIGPHLWKTRRAFRVREVKPKGYNYSGYSSA